MNKPTESEQVATARERAKRYVRGIMAGTESAPRNYTVEDAKREASLGSMGKGEDGGWEIRKGKIKVPCVGKPNWTFSFSLLAAELAREAPEHPPSPEPAKKAPRKPRVAKAIKKAGEEPPPDEPELVQAVFLMI